MRLPASGSDAGPGRFDAESCRALDPGELFTQRIQPLLEEDRPKSCNQCHLSGVDLTAFVRDDACESMACLVEEGLVDLDDPASSTILSWIERAEPDSDLITGSVIEEEYEGFLEWIEYSAACGATACADVVCGGRDEPLSCDNEPEPEAEGVDRLEREEDDCTDLGIETLFRQTVYQTRGRCYPCHYDYASGEIAGNPPAWVITEGSCAEASLSSLRQVQRLGLIDVDEPANSLLLLKPLDEDQGGVPHGGDAKFHRVEDPGYRAFRLFVERYARCERE